MQRIDKNTILFDNSYYKISDLDVEDLDDVGQIKSIKILNIHENLVRLEIKGINTENKNTHFECDAQSIVLQ